MYIRATSAAARSPGSAPRWLAGPVLWIGCYFRQLLPYMVRGVKLETTPSGTYYNPSQGIFATVSGTGPTLPVVTVAATDANRPEDGPASRPVAITRTGATTSSLSVSYTLGGSAGNGVDYAPLATSVSIAAGAAAVTLTVQTG